MLVIYLNGVQVSSFGENCAGKFYLNMALPAHCSGKITYLLFRVYTLLFPALFGSGRLSVLPKTSAVFN